MVVNGRLRRHKTCYVADLICSQEDAPHSHKTPREIQREMGISRTSVCRIAKYDLQLRSFKHVSSEVERRLQDQTTSQFTDVSSCWRGYYCSTFATWRHWINTHTHTQPFYCSYEICPGPPGWAGTTKVKPASSIGMKSPLKFVTTLPAYTSFKRLLKTHYFSRAFP